MFELNCPSFFWASIYSQSSFSCLFKASTNNDGVFLDYSFNGNSSSSLITSTLGYSTVKTLTFTGVPVLTTGTSIFNVTSQIASLGLTFYKEIYCELSYYFKISLKKLLNFIQIFQVCNMRYSCATSVRGLINTNINVIACIFKCSSTSNFYADFGDNDTQTFNISDLYYTKAYTKTYTKTSIFTVIWKMIDINYSMTTQINCNNLKTTFAPRFC